MPYRVTPPVPPDPYEAAWTRLRRRRRWFGAAAALMYGSAFARLLFAQSPWLARSSSLDEVGFVGLLAAATVFFLVALYRQGCARCPHCGGRFGVTRWWSVPWPPRRCVHCGVPLGTPRSAITP